MKENLQAMAMKVPLAPDHSGMRAEGLRYLRENGRGFTYMRNEMADNLELLARRFYTGDITVVDEFLQSYCIGKTERDALCTMRLQEVKHEKKRPIPWITEVQP